MQTGIDGRDGGLLGTTGALGPACGLVQFPRTFHVLFGVIGQSRLIIGLHAGGRLVSATSQPLLPTVCFPVLQLLQLLQCSFRVSIDCSPNCHNTKIVPSLAVNPHRLSRAEEGTPKEENPQKCTHTLLLAALAHPTQCDLNGHCIAATTVCTPTLHNPLAAAGNEMEVPAAWWTSGSRASADEEVSVPR